MEPKYIHVDGLGEIRYIRSRRSKHIRLKISQDGLPVVSSSIYTPKYVVKKFVESKKDWIIENQDIANDIKSNDIIGRSHKIIFQNGTTLKSRIGRNKIYITVPSNMEYKDAEVQKIINQAAIRALKKEANILLSAFIEKWQNTGLGSYKKLSYKKVTSRWGSYSADGTLTMSIFCVQLPNNLIDYIVVHELAHSIHMNHSSQFWRLVSHYIPDYKTKRRELKKYKMRVVPNSNLDMQ